MDFAGMDLAIDDDFEPDDSGFSAAEMSQEELEKFRAFLDEIEPDDFT
jgi:hypothetical protein